MGYSQAPNMDSMIPEVAPMLGSQAEINVEVHGDESPRPSSQIKGSIVNELIKHSKQRPLQSQAAN